MSRSADDREGLSPPAPNILDLFEDDDESDDVYEPVTEESDLASTEDGEEEEGNFAGTSSTSPSPLHP
jgi:hypothetical protein